MRRTSKLKLNKLLIQMTIFLAGILIVLLIRYHSANIFDSRISKPTFAIFTKRVDQENVSLVRKILRSLGYREVSLKDDWNLLWSFEDPFINLYNYIMKLKPYQMVNHAPGMEFILEKDILSTARSLFMPTAFLLPEEIEDFKKYASQHPNKLFVEKGNGHRNVSIKKPQDIDLDSTTTFVQEFLMNPYLVDGYKFDIGIYTVITSIDPVRLYIYTGDVMFRYCQEKFHPFDPNVLDKYVVGDAYRPTWEVPSLVEYFNRYGGSMRASFDAYVRDQGEDPSKIWEQAEEIIRYTVLKQAQNIAERWEEYPRHNFFIIICVDMIVDTDLKVYLLEANLSPNMYSKRFVYNYIIYEQVLYNTLRLVGIDSRLKEQEAIPNHDQRIIAVTADENIASNLNQCVQHVCEKSCEDIDCSLCIPCLHKKDYEILARALHEHLHRGDMRRIFPKAIADVKNYDLERETKNFTMRNQWMTRWFYYKCIYDESWCQ